MRIPTDCGVLLVLQLMTVLITLNTAQSRKGRLAGPDTAVVAMDENTNRTATEPTERHLASRRTIKSGRYRVKPAKRLDQTDVLKQTAQSRDEPTAYRHDSSHCYNGGTGFLETFCFCGAEFTGRYCEHRVNSSCGAVEHGVWVYGNCSYCVCADGQFLCRKHELEGCTYEELEDTAEQPSNKDKQMTPAVQSPNCGSIPKGSTFVIFHTILWLVLNSPVR